MSFYTFLLLSFATSCVRIVETDALCNRGNVNDTISYTKECSANKHNDNKDIFNNDVHEDHNNELGPGEALPLGA